MAENENPESPEAPEAAPTTESPAVPAAAATVPPGPRVRDRLYSFRALVAVAVATLLLGGAGGAAVVAATDDGHDGHDRHGRHGDGPRMSRFDGPGYRDQGRPGRGGPPPMMGNGTRQAPGIGGQPDDAQPDSGSTS
ncbi:MAG: hypothetical protein NTV23_05330 [Propionibacteriales bacterium]|nr:hypothetical protein [Propionibacteriales bacterium]